MSFDVLWDYLFCWEMLIVYGWLIGGYAVLLIFLELCRLGRHGTAKLSPEGRVYRWTLNCIWFHVICGAIIASTMYYFWYYNPENLNPFWACWPMGLVFAFCFLMDFWLIIVVFGRGLAAYPRLSESE